VKRGIFHPEVADSDRLCVEPASDEDEDEDEDEDKEHERVFLLLLIQIE
jgi:hypothetical protein